MTNNSMAIRDKIPEMSEEVGELDKNFIMEVAESEEAFVESLYTALGNLWEIVNDDKIKDAAHGTIVLAEVREILDVLDAKSERAISRAQLNLRNTFGGYDKSLTLVPKEVEESSEE